jgi:hypothetical protein
MADEIDLLLFLDVIGDGLGRKQREFQPRVNPFDEYDEDKFRRRFRLSKSTVWKLLEQIDDLLQSTAMCVQ